MRFNPKKFLTERLGIAIDWRVRDVLEAERQATIELGKTFVTTTARLTDEIRLLEQRVQELEKKIESSK
jgi:hypothetical protein